MIITNFSSIVNNQIIYINMENDNNYFFEHLKKLPCGNLPELKKIDTIQKQSSFCLSDLKDLLVKHFLTLNKAELLLLQEYWSLFSEHKVSLNNHKQFYYNEIAPYRTLNTEERKILYFLICNIVYRHKTFFINYDLFIDSHKHFIKDFIDKNTHSLIIQYTSDINWIYFSHKQAITFLDNKYYCNETLPNDFIKLVKPVIYVEGNLDLFTFSSIFPEKQFKIAGSSSSIIAMAKNEKSHNFNKHNHYYIDRDAYSNTAIKELGKLNIFVHKFSEIENFWIAPDILIQWLPLFNLNQKQIKEIILFNHNNILKKANNNFEQTFSRMIKRQDIIKTQGFHFYDNKEEIENIKKLWQKNLNVKNIDHILTWYDNKGLFDNILNKINIKNVAMFKNIINKKKLNLQQNIFTFL